MVKLPKSIAHLSLVANSGVSLCVVEEANAALEAAVPDLVGSLSSAAQCFGQVISEYWRCYVARQNFTTLIQKQRLTHKFKGKLYSKEVRATQRQKCKILNINKIKLTKLAQAHIRL